jgi:hypothetical protein
MFKNQHEPQKALQAAIWDKNDDEPVEDYIVERFEQNAKLM